MNVQHVEPIRRWLYEAADALDSWEDQSSAAAIRSTAELLGSGDLVRRLRFAALVRTAREVETRFDPRMARCPTCGTSQSCGCG